MFCKLGTEDFLLTSLANSKVQIWGKKGREKIKVLLVLIWGQKKGGKNTPAYRPVIGSIIKVGGAGEPPLLLVVVVVVILRVVVVVGCCCCFC